jgi:hypothetical protein
MAITFLKEKKKQKHLIYIFVGIIFAILIIIWLGFFKKPQPPITKVPTEVSKTGEKIEINFKILENKILENPIFKELKDFEKTPPLEGEAGRENPFLPY